MVNIEDKVESQNLVKTFLEGCDSQLGFDTKTVRMSMIQTRTMQEFWEHCGVDFKKKTILNRSIWGGLCQDDFLANSGPVLECE